MVSGHQRFRSSIAAAALPLAVLTGCAGDFERSYDRWRGHSDFGGPFARWAGCIESRSGHYLDRENAPRHSDFAGENESQLFARVLGDCREHMSGPAWQRLSDREARRLVSDAHRAFGRVRAQIRDRDFQAIIDTGN
jgi:hypothetical protein